uniref:Uncharacterized protein n=1 Tax=Leersia perrieri TaxID=77586 RepID=A0A0D9VVQ7_9ORYZ
MEGCSVVAAPGGRPCGGGKQHDRHRQPQSWSDRRRRDLREEDRREQVCSGPVDSRQPLADGDGKGRKDVWLHLALRSAKGDGGFGEGTRW